MSKTGRYGKHDKTEQSCKGNKECISERLRMSGGAIPPRTSMHSGAEIAGSNAHVRINVIFEQLY